MISGNEKIIRLFKSVYLYLVILGLAVFVISAVKAVKVPNVDIQVNSESIEYIEDSGCYRAYFDTLPRGKYDINVTYESDCDVRTDVNVRAISHRSCYSDNPMLMSYDKNKVFTIWINEDKCEDCKIDFYPVG